MTKLVVLHEIGHSLQRPDDRPWHSPRFARLLMELWEKYADVPRAEAVRIAVTQKPRKVRFAAAADITRPPRQEWKEWKKLEQKLLSMLQECRENEPDMY